MRNTAFACTVAAAVLTTPLLADLRYSMRVEIRAVQVAAAPNPTVAMLAERIGPMLRQSLADGNGSGVSETIGVLGSRGWRLERARNPGAADASALVSIQKPDRSSVMLNTAARTYWTIPAGAQGPADVFEPSVSTTRTGSFDMVAGVKAERVGFEIALNPLDPDLANAMASIGVTLRLTGDAWVAAEYKSYGALALQTYRRPFGLPWVDQELGKLGLIVRAIVRGDLLGGFELEAVLTRVAEDAASPSEFDPPSGFVLIEPPAPGRAGDRIVPPVPVTRVNPRYTSSAMRARLEGTVGLDVVVLADGTVGDVTVRNSLDTQDGLDEEAVAAARQWRFTPGTINGVPSKMHIRLNIEFKLHS
jgi:TonB family protein